MWTDLNGPSIGSSREPSFEEKKKRKKKPTDELKVP
jgi:hypothetical protein